jgi:phage replication-related protein YjqB (UPF0714/DUF867 family)
VTRRFISTQPVEVSERAHLIELLYDDGSHDGTVICAGHGGAVEPGTAELALELATSAERAVCWATLGYEGDGSAFERFHPPSTALSPEEYPLLGEISDRGFDDVLSIHGLADDEVLVGGATEHSVKSEVAERLDSALSVPVQVTTAGEYAGTHPENFVNWLADSKGGLQLELGPTARSDEVEAVRSVLETWLAEKGD